jgi:hypothetical protein
MSAPRFVVPEGGFGSVEEMWEQLNLSVLEEVDTRIIGYGVFMGSTEQEDKLGVEIVLGTEDERKEFSGGGQEALRRRLSVKLGRPEEDFVFEVCTEIPRGILQ